MKLIRCFQGHFYDGEKYPECPNCSGVATMNTTEPSVYDQVSKLEPVKIDPIVLPSEESAITPPLKGGFYSAEDPVPTPIFPTSGEEKEEDEETQAFMNFDSIWEKPDPVIVSKEEQYSSKVIRVIAYSFRTKVVRRVIFSAEKENTTIYVTDIPEDVINNVHIKVSKGLTCFSQAAVYWVSEETANEVERRNKDIENAENRKAREKKIEELQEKGNYLFEQYNMWQSIRKNWQKKLSKKKAEIDIERDSAKFMQVLDKERQLRKEIMEINDKIAPLLKESKKQKKVKRLNSYGKKGLKLVLIAEPKQTYCIDIEYESTDVSWTPSYEIRMRSGERQGMICLYADIDKKSEEPWEDIDFTVSTGIDRFYDPDISNELTPVEIVKKPKKPQVVPEMLPFAAAPSMGEEDHTIPYMDYAGLAENSDIDFEIEQTFNPEAVNTKETSTSVRHEFHLADRISLSAKAEEKIVIWKQDIELQPYYFAVPEKDSAEYMAIRLTELEKYDVIASRAKVYLDDEYTHEIYLNPDELDKQIVIGRAKGVSVKRYLRKKHTNTKKIQGKRIRTYEYVIEVKNDLKQPARLNVLDHFPITSDPDVVIEVYNASEAKIDSATGQCSWDIVIAAEEKYELELCYTITVPARENYEYK